MFARIFDHAARALGRLLTQFQTSAEVRGLTTAYAAEVQTAEDAIYSSLVIRDVVNATGATLDSIGKLVGAPPRGSFNDAQYRLRVNVQILVNKSSGTAADFVAIAKAFHPAWGSTVHTREGGAIFAEARSVGSPTGEVMSSGAIEICVVPFNPTGENDQILTSEARELARFLRAASAGGIRPILKYVSTTVHHSPVFSLADPGHLNPTPRGGSGAGFGVGKLANSLDH